MKEGILGSPPGAIFLFIMIEFLAEPQPYSVCAKCYEKGAKHINAVVNVQEQDCGSQYCCHSQEKDSNLFFSEQQKCHERDCSMG